jgi:hypothetical protein
MREKQTDVRERVKFKEEVTRLRVVHDQRRGREFVVRNSGEVLQDPRSERQQHFIPHIFHTPP